jgi:hypothetical protein
MGASSSSREEGVDVVVVLGEVQRVATAVRHQQLGQEQQQQQGVEKSISSC